MYPFIGVLLREGKSKTGKIINVLYKDIEKAVIKSGGIPLGVSKENFDLYIDLCDGFIIQGGDDVDEQEEKIIKRLQDFDIPTLGICLGMQEMSVVNDGVMYDIDNHLHQHLHEVNIYKDSFLYKIIKKEKILVNSRHRSAIKNTNLMISSVSSDGVVESVEDSMKRFFLGLQWHPENLYEIDSNSKKIFDYFIKICNDK